MAKIRTFIAIEIPSEVREKILEFQEELKKEPARVSWVKPENIHLTLKFLGDVEEERIDQVAQIVEQAAEGMTSFRIAIQGSGAFPNFKQPRVLWVGGQDIDGKLLPLQKNIEAKLGELGFEKENKPYSIHLTLGRVKFPRGVEAVIEKMRRSDFSGGEFPVKELVIMKSELNPAGAIYTPLRKIKL
ncbi:MAG: RNA 2',3'-cyclic phosphodiesterase [candidate division KSB1 bacterium]|nr:RNA 2',3'-cyclic phosphodiesterase [candidate division KSB1 bacterium]